MRRIVNEAAGRFVLNALFPRLCARLRWTSRLGPRGVAVYVATAVAVKFLLNGPLRSWSRRYNAQMEELRRELGRAPTPEEIAERFGWDPPPGKG